MPLVDHDVVLPRERIVEHALKDSDPNKPFVTVSYDRKGGVIVASTHGGPVTDAALEKARKAILEKN